MKDFILDRSRWYRGQGPGESRLRRDKDGQMCCVGLYLESCGVPAEKLTNQCYASSFHLIDLLPEETRWLNMGPAFGSPVGNAGSCIAMTNDERGLSNAERERILTEKFAKGGVALRFVGPQ